MNTAQVKAAVIEVLEAQKQKDSMGDVLGLGLGLVGVVFFMFAFPMFTLSVLGICAAVYALHVFDKVFKKHKNLIIWAYLAVLASPVIAIAGLFLFGVY